MPGRVLLEVRDDVRRVRAAAVVAHVPPRRGLVPVHAGLVNDHALQGPRRSIGKNRQTNLIQSDINFTQFGISFCLI